MIKCGMPRKFDDISGRQFGHLLALCVDERRGHNVYFWFQCRCGNKKSISASHVKSGRQVSCGCYGRARSRTHGCGGTPEYKAWHAMLRRCLDKGHPQFDGYGGRGITVCPTWQASFETFHRDMGNRPTPNHSIDRIDNDGHYQPDNCRWATRKEQCNNRRKYPSKTSITFDGRTMSQSDWACAIGVSRPVLCRRLKTMPLAVALRPGKYPAGRKAS